MAETVHTTSIRLTNNVFKSSTRIAQRRRISFNALVSQALTQIIEQEQDKEMYDAATLLGSDRDGANIEFAFAAQSEVALNDESEIDNTGEEVFEASANHGIRIGDLFMVDWSPGRGSEQTGQRPAVVVQNNPFNANERYPNTIVVAVSKSGRPVPTHIQIQKTVQNGLWVPTSFVKCEQLYTISKERLGRRLGRLTDEQIEMVGSALRRVLSLA